MKISIFNMIEVAKNKIFGLFYPWEQQLLNKVSISLTGEDKEIFDYQISLYNFIRRNYIGREIYLYYLKYGIPYNNFEKIFIKKRTKLSSFCLIINEKNRKQKVYGTINLTKGRVFTINFSEYVDFKKINPSNIEILK